MDLGLHRLFLYYGTGFWNEISTLMDVDVLTLGCLPAHRNFGCDGGVKVTSGAGWDVVGKGRWLAWTWDVTRWSRRIGW